jgi:hypothetical protein
VSARVKPELPYKPFLLGGMFGSLRVRGCAHLYVCVRVLVRNFLIEGDGSDVELGVGSNGRGWAAVN